MADRLGFKVSVSSVVCIWSRGQLLAALWWFSTKFWRMYKLASSLRGTYEWTVNYSIDDYVVKISFVPNYGGVIWFNESAYG